MRLPPLLLESPFFAFSKLDELIRAVGDGSDEAEIAEINRLAALSLPPVTSRHVLATMLGISPGLVWSFEFRPSRHYQTFEIPKGRGRRRITAPRVALKIVQKWLSVHIERAFQPDVHVCGFVKGRSHIAAALVHCGAEWVLSADIQDFFQTTPASVVEHALRGIGYNEQSARLLSRLACVDGALAQGAPTSPVLSNLCFQRLDTLLKELAEKHQAKLTRYADDIVFSGMQQPPATLAEEIRELFEQTPWKLSERKFRLDRVPARLKVHGLLVDGTRIRLTKGYRNRIRAYAHLMARGAVHADDIDRVNGHLRYAEYVDRISAANSDASS